MLICAEWNGASNSENSDADDSLTHHPLQDLEHFKVKPAELGSASIVVDLLVLEEVEI